jgi:hypothetical protein
MYGSYLLVSVMKIADWQGDPGPDTAPIARLRAGPEVDGLAKSLNNITSNNVEHIRCNALL